VTIGSTLAGTPNTTVCVAMISCTYIQSSAGTAAFASPVDGTVVRWRLKAGSAGGTAKLRVLRPSAGAFTAIASSKAETVNLDVNTFTTSLPVKAGDVLALDNDSSGIYFTNSPTIAVPLVLYFQPALADGAAGTPNNQRANVELLMNADVVPAPPGIGPGPGQTPAAPKLSKLKLKPRSFRAAKSGSSIARKAKVGTRVTYTLSSDASVKFVVRRGKKRRGSFTVAGKAGKNKFRFTGRVGKRKLRNGRYRLVATPSAAGKKGKARTVSFRVR
jgi:hypothetical protein